jgi:TolB protein
MKRPVKAILLLASVQWGCGPGGPVAKGRQFLEMGDLARARVQFELAVTSDPRNAPAHLLLAKTHCLADSPEAAVREYAILSRLDPKLADDTLLRQKLALFLGTEPYPSTRLTDAPGNDAFPGISADGRQIAFSSKRDGNPEIYLMSADGSGQRRLTSHPAIDYGPAFSPDGRRIAFVTDRHGNDELYLCHLETGREYRLTRSRTDDFFPRFSPDGQEIFWISDRGGSYAIWRMALGGKEPEPENDPRLFYRCQEGDVAYFDFTDGGILAQREVKNQGFLFRLALDGTAASDLEFPSFRTGIPTVPLPGGGGVAYVSSRDGNDEIYLQQLGSRSWVRLTNHPAEDFVFGFSPDGSKMLFDSRREGDRDVYLMHLDSLITREQLLGRINRP